MRCTSPTQQHVLALLAHRASDKNGMCYPSVDSLAEQTRLNRATVMRALDALRNMGLVSWKPGGRTKGGRSISNLYTLTLPQPLGKLRRSKAAHEYWGEGLPEPTGDPLSFPEDQESRVALRNGAESRCATMQGRTVHNTRVALCDPNIHNKTSINHPDQHHPPAVGEESARFDLGVARRDGTLDEVLEKMKEASEEARRHERVNIVHEAMKACGTTSPDDLRSFTKVMMLKDKSSCIEVVFRFESERKAGEFSRIRNLPALLMSRLQALPSAKF